MFSVVASGCASAAANTGTSSALCAAPQLRLADGADATVRQGEVVELVVDYLTDDCLDFQVEGEPVRTYEPQPRDVILTTPGGPAVEVGSVLTNDGSELPFSVLIPDDAPAGAAVVAIQNGPQIELEIAQVEASGASMFVEYAYYPTLGEMVAQATIVARGSITELADVNEAEGFEATIYSFRADELYKGDVPPGEELLVQVPGTPDMDVSPPHGLEVGRDFVLLLVSVTADPAGIVGGPAGAFLIDGESLVPRSTGPGTVQVTWEDLMALQQP